MNITYNKLIIFTTKPFPILHNIDEWNVQKALNIVRKVKDSYAFMFQEKEKRIDKQSGSYTVNTKTTKQSGVYYFDAYLETIDDIKSRIKQNEKHYEHHDVDQMILQKMEQNKWTQIVRGIKLNWVRAFVEGDVLL